MAHLLSARRFRPANPLASAYDSVSLHRSAPLRFGFALLSVSFALCISLLFRTVFENAPFMLFWVAVFLSSWFGSLGPGLLAVLLSAVSVNYFFADAATISPTFTIQLTIFVLAAGSISWLHERRRHIENWNTRQGKWLETTITSIGEGMIITDIGGCVLVINATASRLTGWSVEEGVGQGLEAVFHLVDEYTRQPVENLALQALRDGRSDGLSGHTQLISRDGTETPVECRTVPVRDDAGVLLGTVLVFRDIAKRRKAEVALQHTEERFRVAQDLSLDAFTILESVRDEEGTVIDFRWVYANHVAGRILKHGPEELIGKRLLDILPGNKEQSALFDRYVQVVETGKPHDIELHYQNEGIDGWFRNMAVPLGDGVAVSFSDITERKRIEAEIRKSEEIVRQQLGEIEVIYDSAPVGLCVLDADLRYVRINERLATINGISAGDHIGRSVREIVPWIADLAEPGFRRVLQTGEPLLNNELSGETAARLGVQRVWLESWVPLKDRSGHVTGINIVVEEITERRRNEEQLRRLKDLAIGLARALTPADVAAAVLDQGMKAARASTGAVAMLVEDSRMLEVIGLVGYASSVLESWRRFPVDMPSPLLARVVRERKPHFLSSREERLAHGPLPPAAHIEAQQAWAAIPLMIGEQVLGGIEFSFVTPRAFDEADRGFLQTIADYCAQALERVQLYEEAQKAAAAEERERLARELHDAVTQTLFTANMIAEALPRQLQKTPEKVPDLLRQLHQLTRNALAEMRMLLLELRPSALLKATLKSLLGQLADVMRSRKAIAFQFEVDDWEPPLSEVKIALYRMAQEALNNIVKHASASQVGLSLKADYDQVELRIWDDGRGFDPAAVDSTSLGLAIMRERAAAIGATFDVRSAPGEGTCISVTWEDEEQE